MFNRKKENLGKAYKNSSVPSRVLGLLVIIVIIIIFWNFVIPYMVGHQTIEDDYEKFDDVTGAEIQAFTERVEESSPAIIENPTSDSGKLAVVDDKNRIEDAKKQGGSAIAALMPVEQSSDNDIAAQLAEMAKKAVTTESPRQKEASRNTDWITQSRAKTAEKRTSGNQSEPTDSNSENQNKYEEKDVLSEIPSDILEELIRMEEGGSSYQMVKQIYSAARESSKKTSNGFVAIKTDATRPNKEASLGRDSRYSGNSEGTNSNGNTDSLDANEKPIIINQGKMISAESGFPIDSRFNKDFVLTIDSGALAGATLSCSYTRTDNVLIPTCSDITYMGEAAPITAVMLNPMTMGPVIEQYRDDETLLEMMGLLITGAAKVYGENKLKQGTRSQVSDTQTVTSQNLSDSELVAGSVSTIVGNLSSLALQKFVEPDIINVPAKVPMMVALLKPLRANWKLEKPLEPGVDYYEQ